MATTIQSLVTSARVALDDPSDTDNPDPNWTDAELVDLANRGIKDLWRKLNDLYEDYFTVIDDTNVTLAANTSSLSGLPAAVFRVVTIEPRVVGSSSPNAGLVFKPRRYNHPDFQQARAQDPQAPQSCIIFYALMQAGAPVAAPHIEVAPQVSAAVNLRLVYNGIQAAAALGDPNPVPGESDNAIIAWIVAYARARERDDRAPDPEWIAIYGTEKTNLMTELTPRSIQEPETADALFQDLWPDFQ